mmetsp:Transcript_48853/g.110870  ORF Transcript_48853/g.110870 Transcript_48853/m.110870 type:complete len:411 (+) Transcript_48853:122-1354(+)
MRSWLRAAFLLSFLSLTHASKEQPATPEQQEGAELWRIGFGSCHQQYKPTPIFDSIISSNVSAFAFLGDAVYNDYDDCQGFWNKPCGIFRRYAVRVREVKRALRLLWLGGNKEKAAAANLDESYAVLGVKLSKLKFCEKVDTVATWDDHDYGENDAGSELPWKEESAALFTKFWSSVSPRMAAAMSSQQECPQSFGGTRGVYTSHDFGKDPETTARLILLDARTARTELTKLGTVKGEEDYIPTYDPNARVLSEEQWQWFEAELFRPGAALLIVGSGTQVLRDANMCEHWDNFPKEKERLLRLIESASSSRGIPVVIISGDVHYSELSKHSTHGWLFDATSSGLTETWPEPHPNLARVDGDASVVTEPNFGVLVVDWISRQLTVEFHDELGLLRYAKSLKFNDITAPRAR